MATIYLTTSTKEDGRGRVQVLVRLSGGHGVTPRAKSGIFINPTQWDSKKQRLNVARIGGAERAEALEAQRQLDELVAHIHEAFDNLKDRTTATSEWLGRVVAEYHHPGDAVVLSDFEKAFEEFLTEKRYSHYRDYSFRQVLRCLHRWGVIRDREVSFGALNERLLADFEVFLRDEHRYASDPTFAELYTNAKDARSERSANTLSGMLVRLRTFYLWAVGRGYVTASPFDKYKVRDAVYGTPFYLTIEERRHLASATMPTDALAVVRDIFIFQCCVGCRVGDLTKLTPDNVIGGAVEYVPRKTKDGRPLTVRVVLNETAKGIIERYADREDGKLLPFVADAYYNRCLKEVFKAAGLERMVSTLDPKTRQEVRRPLWEVATSHLARRTFVGNLYRQIKDPNIIASMSGHKEGSRAFARYRAIDDQIKAEAVALLD